MNTVPTLRVVSKDRAPELPQLSDEVRLALSEAAASAREGLLAMSVAAGLAVMQAMFEAEVTGSFACLRSHARGYRADPDSKQAAWEPLAGQ
jgi:hypothetical protein